MALRSASETEPVRPAPAVTKPRNPKRQKLDSEIMVDSPGPVPSPSVVLPAARIKGNSAQRSGSVPSTREAKAEPTVKTEDAAEGIKSVTGEKAGRLFVGAEVAYKGKRKEDGSEWIQCTIVGISDDGKKTRYIRSACAYSPVLI